SSTHNTHIEQAWVEVGQRFACPWQAFFLRLERLHHLDRSDPNHLWVLHHLFLHEINADCTTFCEEWNAHPISGEGHDQSPNDLQFTGQLEHGMYKDDATTIHPHVYAHYGVEHSQDQDDADWEDIGDHGNEISDLPSRIAAEQSSQFLHEAAEVPGHINPFTAATLAAFTGALAQVQQLNHIPTGLGIREEEWDSDGYPEIEVIQSGQQGRRELAIELPHSLWYGQAVCWCQALEVFNHTLAFINETSM
ncbi:hypothetical protein EDC04DRAFT_2586052, partial [Pisolithus marmoratus]